MDRTKLLKYLLLLTATGFFCALLGVVVLVFKPDYALTNKKQLLYQDPESAVMSASDSAEARVSPPEFSRGSGYYDSAFDLELSAPDNCRIYYTIDSSVPDEESLLYEGTIHVSDPSKTENVSLKLAGSTETEPVEKGYVLRAVAYDADGNRSNVITQTYFFHSARKDANAQLPTISLVSDPINLFDPTLGIDSNYEMEQWEREAFFAYYDVDGTHVFDQTIGVRIRGTSTRSDVKKDFTLFARNKYDGSDHFPFALFSNPTDSLILRLRTDGQKEGFLSSLVSDRDLTIQEYQMVNLYLNGEFWGIYSLLSRIDEYYLSHQYGLEENNIALVKINHFPEGSKQAMHYYSELVDFLTSADMSVPENYRKACEMIDIQSLIDYYVTSSYINNIDTNPFEINSVMWRTVDASGEGLADGRWRFGLYDLDHATSSRSFGLIKGLQSKQVEQAYQFNYFVEFFPYGAKGPIEDPYLTALMASPDFRRQFYDSFYEIATRNFNPDRVLALLDKLPSQEGKDHLADFFVNRPAYIFPDFEAYMQNYLQNYNRAKAEADASKSHFNFPLNSGTASISLAAFSILSIVLVALTIQYYGGNRRRKGGER